MSAVEPIRPKFAGGTGIGSGGGNGAIEKMKSAHAWAGRQINRAQQLIRELSIVSPDPREVSLQ